MIKGADLSSLSDIEAHGGKFYSGREELDCLDILKDKGFDLIRLRLFNDPYDENGISYGAGRCDLQGVTEMAERVKAKGFRWLLDFHYSDCWADPGKQRMPKAWRGLSLPEMAQALYSFTRNALAELKNRNIAPGMIAVGNEITNGLCWPVGHISDRQALVTLLNAGIRACREELPAAGIMLHLDNGGKNELYRDFFDTYFRCGGADFDIIGLSYYTIWHGPMHSLKENMDDLAVRYHKDLIVAETSYPFSVQDYQDHEGLADSERKGMAARPEILKDLPFDVSQKGQAAYMRSLMELIDSVAEDRGKGFIYWGGESIPVKGVGWASPQGIEYMQEKGPGGNEWANQALFDYDGTALKILDVIKNYPQSTGPEKQIIKV